MFFRSVSILYAERGREEQNTVEKLEGNNGGEETETGWTGTKQDQRNAVGNCDLQARQIAVRQMTLSNNADSIPFQHSLHPTGM